MTAEARSEKVIQFFPGSHGMLALATHPSSQEEDQEAPGRHMWRGSEAPSLQHLTAQHQVC